MDSYWESAMHSAGYQFESGPVDIEPDWFQKLTQPVAILGKVYYPPIDHTSLVQDIRSRIHCTYRHSFVPIGEPSGPTSDQGWGCMHRCGQMMLAHALMVIHLGRDWRWDIDLYNPIYARIEDLFHDVKGASYSIHQIASMGMAESRDIGKWFGPNTVAQVIRKLSLHDEWNKIVVHISMEEGIIIDELKQKCQSDVIDTGKATGCSGEESLSFIDLDKLNPPPSCLVQHVVSDDCVEVLHMPCVATNITTNRPTQSWAPSPHGKQQTRRRLFRKTKESEEQSYQSFSPLLPSDENITLSNITDATNNHSWKPLLLIIPLRLGLNRTNPQYLPALKKCLELRQSAGILGGWPRHALWILGHTGEHFIYLDPHFTQPSVTRNSSVNEKTTLHHQNSQSQMNHRVSPETISDDGSKFSYAPSCSTYHTIRPGRIHGSQIDPSLGLGFICESEAAFDELCDCLRREVLRPASVPLFEIHDTRPAGFRMMVNSKNDDGQPENFFSFTDADSDDEYEII